jgi:hypothetical protein
MRFFRQALRMKKLGAIGASLYALLCLATIFTLPMNEYEWMLDDPKARAEGLGFCGLPLDDGIDARIIALVVLLPLLIAGGALSVKKRRLHYAAWLVLVLLLVWGWRFPFHYPLCPGRESF